MLLYADGWHNTLRLEPYEGFEKSGSPMHSVTNVLMVNEDVYK